MDWDRSKDANDSYPEILLDPNPETDLKEGKYALWVPLPKNMVPDEYSQDTGDQPFLLKKLMA